MSLAKVLQSIGNFIHNLFSSAVKDLDTIILPAAIAVTNAAKTLTDLDTTDIFGHLAGSAGAALEDKLKALLPLLVPKLQLAQQFLTSSQDSATILANVLKLVSNAPAVTQTAFWVEFSGLVATDLANGPLTIDEAIQLAQYYYKNYPQPTPATIGTSIAPITGKTA